MDRIRTEDSSQEARNPWTGRQESAQKKSTDHSLTNSDGIESHVVDVLPASSCGCCSLPAGFCAECTARGLSGTACARCLGWCTTCHKPICPKHSVFPEDNPEGRRWCRSCYDEKRRRSFARGVLRSLLSPLVQFENSNE